MPLESCPVCGYAVSTVTNQCRHCASSPPITDANRTRLFIITLSSAIISGAMVLLTINGSEQKPTIEKTSSQAPNPPSLTR